MTTPQSAAALAEEAKRLMFTYMQATLTCADRATDQNVKGVRRAEDAVWVAIDALAALATDAATQRPGEAWVSVDERLPPEDAWVLVTKDGGVEDIELDIIEEGCWREWTNYVDHVEIIGGRTSDVRLYTHWAPVPLAAFPAAELKKD